MSVTTDETPASPSWPSKRDFYAERGGAFSGESDYGHFNWDDEMVRPSAFLQGGWMHRRSSLATSRNRKSTPCSPTGRGTMNLAGTCPGSGSGSRGFSRQAAEARAREKVA